MVAKQNMAWSIGRANTDQADILLPDETVSRVHATLNLYKHEYYIIDNNSLNGTYIIDSYSHNEKAVDDFIQVNMTDMIRFGQFKCSLEDLISVARDTPGTLTIEPVVLKGKRVIKEEKITPKPVDDQKIRRKKMRCKNCWEVVYNDEQCPNCGSTEHMGVKL